MKKIFLLGATGSVGKNTLKVIAENKDLFSLIGIAADSNLAEFKKICDLFNPKYLFLNDPHKRSEINPNRDQIVLNSYAELESIFSDNDVDIIISAIVGFEGLKSTFAAAKTGKTILLANKESIVAGGQLLIDEIQKNKSKIIPLDSEHNAILQCLPDGRKIDEVKEVLITASGGPFFGSSEDDLKNVSIEEALAHPNWQMGAKISVDSATLINKCLELIEASYLFDLDEKKIRLVIHPQSIIHSIVTYINGSSIAQMSNPSMKIPLASALGLTLGNRKIPISFNPINFDKLELNFFKFPEEHNSLESLARDIARSKNSSGIIFNAANEIGVEAFLENKIQFTQIKEVISRTFDTSCLSNVSSIEEIFEIDKVARNAAHKVIKSLN